VVAGLLPGETGGHQSDHGEFDEVFGGNNAAVVTASAELDLASRSIVFAAAGTAGQRCTTMRRLIMHADVAEALVDKLRAGYGKLSVGDPFEAQTLVGPLINAASYQRWLEALDQARRDGGEVLAADGSDCGIANVNIGTSGAEIGGAFGGEKETGGGRESGSDAWRAYMRRATNTINYSDELRLAQDVSFL